MYKLRLSTAAETDIRRIATHTLDRWEEQQRDAYVTELFDAFSRLADTPQIAARIESVRKGYRKFPQGSHVIYFRGSNTHKIEIIRVLHKRMDAKTHLGSP